MKLKKENWVIKRRGGAMEEMVSKLGITPAFARILCGRGYDTAEKAAAFLYLAGAELTQAEALPDADRFCAFLMRIREAASKVRVIGDYDADGVTATYLMLSGLAEFGITADYRIPNRITDGYGISVDMVKEAVRDGVKVLITVDNGIAAVEPVHYAKEAGLTVLITDHHEPQEVIPEADVIVDYKLIPDYDGTAVCGAVVAGRLMDELLRRNGKEGFWERNLEVLALATVADVMQLTGDNRIIVQRALAKPVSMWNIGLQCLMEANHLTTAPKAYTLGYVLAPCINALGRLAEADPGVKLLMEENPDEAKKLAEKMVEANRLRKEMTTKAIEATVAVLDAEEQPRQAPIVFYSEQCHESIAGIVAGKLRERYYLPAIVLCRAEDEKYAKGSGRSIEEYSIFEGLQSCAGLLERFGGHSQACGLTVSRDNIPAFRQALAEHFQRNLQSEVSEKITIDLAVHFADLTPQLVAEISRMEPFGNGNHKPVLAVREAKLVRISHFGKATKYTRLVLEDEHGDRITGVYFGNADEFVTEAKAAYGEEAVKEIFSGFGNSRINVLFSPQYSTYSHEIEITVDHFRMIP